MKRIWMIAAMLVMAMGLLIGCGDNGGEQPPVANNEEEVTVVDAYLAVIDDIYLEDDGLNDGITIMAIDPQDSILSEEQKSELFAVLEETYGLEIMEKTFEQLSEEGYLEEEGFLFKNGIKISITKPFFDENALTFTCGVQKWRSGLGAVGSDAVTAVYDGEQWTVTKEDIYMS